MYEIGIIMVVLGGIGLIASLIWFIKDRKTPDYDGNPDFNKENINTDKKQSRQKVCPSCGQPIKNDSSFCVNCGQKL